MEYEGQKMKKKIFIIGGTGFIGKRLVKKLSKSYDLTLLIRDNNEIKGMENFGLKIKLGDMFEKNSIENAMEKYDVVIHLASSHLKNQESQNYIGAENIF